MKFIKEIFGQLKTDPNLVGRILMILAILGVLALAIFLSGPKPDNDLYPIPTSTKVLAAESPNPKIIETLAYDPFSEYAQTSGVAVGAAALVVILLLGTFIEILSQDRNKEK